ncbi:MAG: DNA methyltransferase, partial [Promethearchaeota archaeon]
MSKLESDSVDLVITSPPYPMIEMWDSLFCTFNEEIGKALDLGDALRAFELMHFELEKIWDEVTRVLKPGGIACINIGDATRTLRKVFQLFP